MEIDQEMYPIENVASFDTYLDLKPLKKRTIIKQEIITMKLRVRLLEAEDLISIIKILKKKSFLS